MPPLNPCTRSIIAVAIGQMLLPANAQAAVFNVSNATELKNAIITANSNGENDNILLGGNTITLTAVHAGNNGLPIISEANYYTDFENGAIVRSAAAPDFRILEVAAGAESYLYDMTLSGGDLAAGAGGAILAAGQVALIRSTLSGNSALVAGAVNVPSGGQLTISNSTISGNSSTNSAIYNAYGSLQINRSTIANNSGGGVGSKTKTAQGYLAINNSVLADQATGVDLFVRGDSDFTPGSGGHNFIESQLVTGGGSSGFVDGENSNTLGVDPLLGPLANNGGSTLSHLPQPGSPLIDAIEFGNSNCRPDQAAYSQGNILRPSLEDPRCDIGSTEILRNQIIVTSDEDALSGVVGCGLREAISSFNSGVLANGCTRTDNDHGNLITFDGSLSGTQILLSGAELEVNSDIYINANSVGGVTLDAGENSRVLKAGMNSSLAIHSLTITGGMGHTGGGIFIDSNSQARIASSTITDNYASYGGGLNNRGQLLVIDSTISGNSAIADGGGIYEFKSDLKVVNSTIANNVALTDDGGGIWSDGFSGNGSVRLVNSTIANNRSGGSANQIYLTDTGLSLRNSILANSNTATDCLITSGGLDTDSASIIEDGSCDMLAEGGRIGDPGLNALTSNGGPTKTKTLRANSIARDTGINATCVNFDQRGKPREDGFCDVGAVEFSLGDDAGGFIVIPLPGGKAVVVPD